MRVLLSTFGSLGDILPMVGLGTALKRRGARVTMLANEHFRPTVEAAGLEMVSHGNPELYKSGVRPPTRSARMDLRLASYVVFSEFMSSFEALRRTADQSTEPTVLVGSTLAFCVRCLQELSGRPTAIVHFSPSVLRSSCELARRAAPLPAWVTNCGLNLAWWLTDRLFLDRVFGRPLNHFRRMLGLPAVSRVFHHWIHAGDITLGLFPEWFAGHPPDWPRQTVLTGFPRFELGRSSEDLPPELEEFLAAGPPPVVFTFGTGNVDRRRHYEVSAQACQELACRGVLVTPYLENLPARATDGVMQVPFAPFAKLFPRASVVAHHAGIGNTWHALAAGRPQLLCPFAHDQFDNSARVQRLGAGLVLSHRKYTVPSLCETLETLMQPPFKARAQELAPWIEPEGAALDRAADRILSLIPLG